VLSNPLKGPDTQLAGKKDRAPAYHWHAIAASYLGWTLDAFDFFIVVFLVDVLARQFGVSKAAIIWTITATLAMRPVGALLFGLLADRYGRRKPLIANVVFFSVMELLAGFAPNYTAFLVLRILFGIGMGGEWGLGASLAMESAPQQKRGLISGVLQSGYSTGYLLAAIATAVVLPSLGWRAMFWAGGAPALLAFYISWRVKESEAWKQHRAPGIRAILTAASAFWKTFLYMVLLMALMNALSHGTQDLYPDFLKTSRGFSSSTVSHIAMIYNVGAILGGIAFGRMSETWGRRRGMIAALFVALAVIPFWAFGSSLLTLAAGAFLMQVGVQGAWGIIPAHLNELSPDAIRGLVPGFSYQLGILLAAPTNTIEYALRNKLGYSWALAAFEIGVIAVLTAAIAFGIEKRGKVFVSRAPQAASTQ
jgi:SHS family lactate transporter-like MFS transporter